MDTACENRHPPRREARGPGVAAEPAAWEWDPFAVPALHQHGEKPLTPAVSVGLLPYLISLQSLAPFNCSHSGSAQEE